MFPGKLPVVLQVGRDSNPYLCAHHYSSVGLPTITTYVYVGLVPPAGIEPAPQTGTDFESVAATISPRGFVWAFHVSQRSGPKYEKTFNIYSRALPLCCPGTNRTCIVGTKIQCVSRCTTGQLYYFFATSLRIRTSFE